MGPVPIDWGVVGWALVVGGLSAAAAVIGRFTARLFVRATGSRVARR